jgi:predicted aspartyl protease
MVCFFLACENTLFAQQNKNQEVVSLSFKRVGSLLVVDGALKGETGAFIIDTGAPRLVLNATYFRQYGKVMQAGITAGGLSGTVQELRYADIDSFYFGSLLYRNLEASIIDLSHLEDLRQIKILGLIGTALFEKYLLSIDFVNSNLTLSDLGKKEPSFDDADFTTKFTLENQVIITKITLLDKKLNFCIDTGAEINVVSNKLPQSVLDSFVVTRRVTLNGTGKNKLTVFVGTIPNLKMGTFERIKPEVMMTSMRNLNKFTNTTLDGMIGADFFEGYKVILDFNKGKLWMYKM